MLIQQLLLYLFGALMLGSALMVVTRRNPMHAAIWLVATFVAMAFLFVVMDGPFVAAVQLLVYAGGIMVLYMFVVMMVNLSEADLRKRMLHHQVVLAITLAASILTVALVQIGPRLDDLVAIRTNVDLSITTMATRLFTEYLLPFEVVSILLLAALIGAVITTKRDRTAAPAREDRP